MLHYKVGNLLSAPQKVIAHQVNCQGKMGSGVAKAIRDKYSKVYEDYLTVCKTIPPKSLCGMTQMIVDSEHVIVNLFGQEYYGYDGKRYTSYAYLTKALDYLFRTICRFNTIDSNEIGSELYSDNAFAIPYKMGCDRGGADWGIVESILEDLSDLYGVDVYIYSLEGY